jgi:hypothetical protein
MRQLPDRRNVVRIICLMGALLYGTMGMASSENVEQPRRVVLVGASIGKAWHFEHLGERVKLPGYRFEYLGVYDFDKGKLVSNLVTNPDKPDIVLIKECATYFPGDVEQYHLLIKSWVDTLLAAGIRPVIVTTAPVAEPTGLLPRAKTLIKRLLGMQTTHESVMVYNDWLKEYAKNKNIPLFDLEAVLRRSANERWLKPEYDEGDGLHLNAAAYTVMDHAFSVFLMNPQLKPAMQ